jgi:hypothetical protein
MALTVIQTKNAAPKDRGYKLFDSRGLFLLVTKAGAILREGKDPALEAHKLKRADRCG